MVVFIEYYLRQLDRIPRNPLGSEESEIEPSTLAYLSVTRTSVKRHKDLSRRQKPKCNGASQIDICV